MKNLIIIGLLMAGGCANAQQVSFETDRESVSIAVDKDTMEVKTVRYEISSLYETILANIRKQGVYKEIKVNGKNRDGKDFIGRMWRNASSKDDYFVEVVVFPMGTTHFLQMMTGYDVAAEAFANQILLTLKTVE